MFIWTNRSILYFKKCFIIFSNILYPSIYFSMYFLMNKINLILFNRVVGREQKRSTDFKVSFRALKSTFSNF